MYQLELECIVPIHRNKNRKTHDNLPDSIENDTNYLNNPGIYRVKIADLVFSWEVRELRLSPTL